MPFPGKTDPHRPIGAVVTSRGNARVKQLRAAFAEQSRLGQGLVAIEGEHLLEEALRSGLLPETVFVSDRRSVPDFVPSAVDVVFLAQDVFASAVETPSPQGIAALLAPPAWTIDDILHRSTAPLLLVAAGLQDPGNLGTLIRSAEAFGASGLLSTPGTVSAWNGKAMRSSAGSVFRLPIVRCSAPDLRSVQRNGITVMAAVGSRSGRSDPPQSLRDVDLRQPTAFLIGNEGAGLAPEWIALADLCVTIPCPGPVESLNAAIAGSLLLYEASRQRALPNLVDTSR